MKLRQATHAVFTVGVACLFLYGERWKIKMDLQYATTTTGGVLSAREAFKNPELVLNHITEEGQRLVFLYKISKFQGNQISIGTMS